MFNIIFQLIRPHHYIKNSFVFAGIIFGHQWALFDIIRAFYIFIAFCFVASSVYIFNDIIDIDHDKNHPKKMYRPLPSGKISIKNAYITLITFLLSSLITAYSVSYEALYFVFGYFILNIFYSLSFKNIVILDVFTISVGFMLRIMAGTIGLNIEPSLWLLLCGFMITLFLGFSKRFSEIKTLKKSTQKIGTTRFVLKQYNLNILKQFMTICATCTIICYGLYTVAPETIAIHGSVQLIYSLPLVAYGVLRYLLLVYLHNHGHDASKEIFADKHIYITMIAWLSLILWLLS